jgi:hypothetical protein
MAGNENAADGVAKATSKTVAKLILDGAIDLLGG